METPTVSELIQILAFGVEEKRRLSYTLVLSLTLLIYDWLVTLNLEISLVWGAPRNGTNLLFFLNRYLPFIDISITMYFGFGYALPLHVCELTFAVFGWMFVIGQCSAALILTLRTWAVCGKSKLSTYGLFGAFGITVTWIIILNALYLQSSTVEASPVPQLLGCMFNTNGSAYLALMYVLHMFYDGCLLLLMVVHAVHAFRTPGESQLIMVVFRDGILYYLYIFGLSLVNALAIFTLQVDVSKTMLVSVERVALSILASRVVLHIREQMEVGKQGFMPSEQITGPLCFAHATQGTKFITTDIGEELKGQQSNTCAVQFEEDEDEEGMSRLSA